MSGDYWDDQAQSQVLYQLLHDAEQLWEFVYSRMEMAFADIDASHPTIDELEAGAKDETDEVSILREAAYEIVQAALVYLRP